jgi:hypothetical protein
VATRNTGRWFQDEEGVVRHTATVSLHVPRELILWLVNSSYGRMRQDHALDFVREHALRLADDGRWTCAVFADEHPEVVPTHEVDEYAARGYRVYRGPSTIYSPKGLNRVSPGRTWRARGEDEAAS